MAYIEDLTSGDPDILLQLNEHLNLNSHRAAVGTFVRLEQCWFWIVLVSVAGRSVSQGISKRGQWNFKVSWSILSSCRKPTTWYFLMFFQCGAKESKLDSLEKGWTWMYTDPRTARSSMRVIQSTAQNMVSAKLPAAVGGLFLLLELPSPSRYLCSACAGKIQPSQGCVSALCLTKETDSKACLIFAGVLLQDPVLSHSTTGGELLLCFQACNAKFISQILKLLYSLLKFTSEWQPFSLLFGFCK